MPLGTEESTYNKLVTEFTPQSTQLLGTSSPSPTRLGPGRSLLTPGAWMMASATLDHPTQPVSKSKSPPGLLHGAFSPSPSEELWPYCPECFCLRDMTSHPRGLSN